MEQGGMSRTEVFVEWGSALLLKDECCRKLKGVEQDGLNRISGTEVAVAWDSAPLVVE